MEFEFERQKYAAERDKREEELRRLRAERERAEIPFATVCSSGIRAECRLIGFELVTPKPGKFSKMAALRSPDVPVAKGDKPRLRATLTGPKGNWELTNYNEIAGVTALLLAALCCGWQRDRALRLFVRFGC